MAGRENKGREEEMEEGGRLRGSCERVGGPSQCLEGARPPGYGLEPPPHLPLSLLVGFAQNQLLTAST